MYSHVSEKEPSCRAEDAYSMPPVDVARSTAKRGGDCQNMSKETYISVSFIGLFLVYMTSHSRRVQSRATQLRHSWKGVCVCVCVQEGVYTMSHETYIYQKETYTYKRDQQTPHREIYRDRHVPNINVCKKEISSSVDCVTVVSFYLSLSPSCSLSLAHTHKYTDTHTHTLTPS